MHIPDLKPRFSVFYKYQVYPFERPREMRGEKIRHKVVIVGAGPIGMTTALLLARYGVPSVVLESEAQVSYGSRAAAFTRRSMEILQQADAHRPFIENGLEWSKGSSYYRGREVFRLDMQHDDDDRFKPAVNNSQQYIEQYLVEAIKANELIELRWQSKSVEVLENAGLVSVKVDTPEGEYVLTADWLIAADGGRSAIRSALGLRMVGKSYVGNFVITDLKAPGIKLSTERRCYFDPEWSPGNVVLVHRQPNDIWRFDYKLPDDEAPEEAIQKDRVAERINLIMKMIGQNADWEVDWTTVYSANTLTLPDYKAGRIFFAGDAAHLLPVFGVRGANTGLQDAENLAWKLAFVVRGWADETILESYSQERVMAAREICEEAGRSTRFMSPPSIGYRLMRDAVLSFSITETFCRELMHWRTSRPHEYHDSELNAVGDDNLAIKDGFPAGAVIRNVKLSMDSYLFDHLTPGVHLILFAAGQVTGINETIAAVNRFELPVQIIVVGTKHDDADLYLADENKCVARKFGMESGGAYLVRPDLHVYGRWHTIESDKIVAALKRIGRADGEDK